MKYLNTGSKRFYAAILGAISIIGIVCIIHVETGGNSEDWMQPFIAVSFITGGAAFLAIVISAILLVFGGIILIGIELNKVLNKTFKL